MNSFEILLNYLKSGDSDGKNVPPLDKIPTNEFIEKFLESDSDGELDIDTSPLGGRTKTTDNLASRGTLVTSRGKAPDTANTRRGATGRGVRSGRHTAAQGADDSGEDTETVLDVRESRLAYDPTGQKAYESACRQFAALPCSSLHRKLEAHTSVDLKHYGAGPRGAKALAIPMLVNTKITSLNLQGNSLGATGVDAIAQMMLENEYITELNLSQNNLKSEGAKIVAKMLADNQTLNTLDLSDNHFTDNDAKILAKPIEESPQLKYLNLSHNDFGEEAGVAFKRVIAENGVLQQLDLSWNHIRGRGAAALAKGLKENVGLKELLLGWNGFGDAGAREMALALKVSTINHLDLSANRVGSEGFLSLIKVLKDNEDLKILRVGRNPVPENVAVVSLQFLLHLDEVNLQELDLSEVTFGRLFVAQLTELKDRHTSLQVTHGYTDSYGKRRLKTFNVVQEAMGMMNQYCDEHNINIVELFSRFDADGSMCVSYDEFKQGLRDARIPVTDYQIEELIKMLDQDGDGEIDFSEMVLGAEMYKAV